ncbi:ABC transporter substrate-binding protein [Mesotoga sp. Brook.08.YT.4.2.5.1]|uniref:ABC transporter substrate-binding protein n=1 Tax=unclassified Mesotoga TaxID=1184398 RepID=UPI000C185873|nr:MULTISPECIES: sugar ABC transporter substrate-binding protein [unclassified Mesotoga]RAM58664.1 ABC transporter substrate-binding protein [Mesotoga sp. SC_4PWL113PWK15]PNE19971.1 ABC transporter substrate-binding protein [Mesotoga sp. Brook.08.YT.4.2.5.1]PVD17809.1 ABC transporter substrate-binding protein [Mesotoga sp. Brook.08.105.5.1]RAO96011.1 ABC transporter substrate-binding protein [Mesotoga sp. Brook.08.YT.4.2.5.4.]RDI93526.1 ABC transporter substrate-binding protein [Mesotoga sp. B
MKRLSVILLVLLMLAVPISALGKITITWWINPWRIAPPGFPADKAPTEEDFPKWAAEEFMRLHPDVEVKYVVVGNTEYSQKMAAAIATGTQPDIFKGPVWDNRWVGAGLLEPIDDYISPEDLEDFYDLALETGYVDGKHYIWPWNLGTNGMGTSMLLYTPDFEKAGVDWRKIVEEGWTMEEFVEIAKKLTWDSDGDGKIDHYAISFGAQDTHNLMNFIYAHGAKLTNEDETKVTFNTPEAVAGLQFLLDLVEVHKVAPSAVEAMGVYDVIGNFHSHRTSIGFGGPYEIGRITRYVKSGQLTESFYPVIAPFPHVEGKKGASYATASGFVVFKQNDKAKRDAVMEFAKFLTNKENTALLESLTYLTARKSVNAILFQNDDYLNEQAQTFARIMDETGMDFFGSQSFPWSEISKFFTSSMQGAFGKTKTAQEALDSFVTEANRALSYYF